MKRRRLGQCLVIMGVILTYATSKDETTLLVTVTAAFAMTREIAAHWGKDSNA